MLFILIYLYNIYNIYSSKDKCVDKYMLYKCLYKNDVKLLYKKRLFNIFNFKKIY